VPSMATPPVAAAHNRADSAFSWWITPLDAPGFTGHGPLKRVT
jgi:hypothetical protein